MVSNIDKLISHFVGLSTDEKPIAANGSSFFEMDTGDQYFYSTDDSDWIKPGSAPSNLVGYAIVGTATAG